MTRILLSNADVTQVEEKFVLDAMRSGWIAPVGPDIDAFEAEVAARVGTRGAVALSSGTAALHLGLLELGARPGTVVLVPSMTFIASANAVVYTGATPVFVDSRSSDGNVDPELMIQAVDALRHEGVTVAAVMTVDLFGRCADYPAITAALAARGVPLLEDAAEALGASAGDRAAGSFGAAGVLSFNGNKIMTTSGGGMLLSDNLELIARCRYRSTQARQPAAHYEHTEIGYNYRLSNILAALGRGQLTRLDGMVARRVAIRQRYADGLAGIPGVRLLSDDVDRRGDSCWLTSILLDPEEAQLAPDALIKSLDDADVEARRLWKPMHLQPVFAGARMFSGGACEQLFDRGVTLPSGSVLTDADIDRVVTVIRAALGCAEQ